MGTTFSGLIRLPKVSSHFLNRLSYAMNSKRAKFINKKEIILD